MKFFKTDEGWFDVIVKVFTTSWIRLAVGRPNWPRLHVDRIHPTDHATGRAHQSLGDVARRPLPFDKPGGGFRTRNATRQQVGLTT